ncbi:MAG TPA: HAMP domain-containing sensor histidine kinase [Anaeromyxobacter sp.]|nr:HAMP domain-containing sensor histidine kinase [Anaeromyxobacter sp.]
MPSVQKAIEREELSRVFGYMVALRVVVVPVVVLVMGWLLWVEPALWRRVVLGVAMVTLPTFFLVELVRYRRGGLSRSAIPVNLLLACVGQLAVSFVSGGVQSPFLLVAIPLGILTAVLIKPPLQLLVPLLQLATTWAMAYLGVSGRIPDFNLSAFGGGSRLGAGATHVWATAVMLTVVLVMSQILGRALRKTFESILRRKLAAQQESLREHRERAEELTALSAEIAHELKNPLASVKGLSGLLSQHLPDGKGAERLAVLRREVERMQSILDEFLNFSRPLVPLALGECDVSALCQEVAALHEGMARERTVTLLLEGAAVMARCDPRKVKQVLINLVQNALDASPPGGEVRIAAERSEAGGALVRVLDRGRGVDPGLGESVFLPGITTKANGSGLGLTIARSLARQHGGDLLLRSRTGGGTEALLVLPAVPAEADPGRAA